MSKKKKSKPSLKLNNQLIESTPFKTITVDDFRLPETLGNPPKVVQQMNDKAFDAIMPQLEMMMATPSNSMVNSVFLGYPTLVNLSQNSLIRAGVEMRGDEMTRKWGELKRKGDAKPDEEEQKKFGDIAEEMEKFKIRELFRSASCLCGYLGGCLLFIDTGEDEGMLAEPLILDKYTFKKGKLKGFKIIEPYLVTPGGYNSVNPMKDDYFKPTLWYVQGVPVHGTRLIYFAENKLTSMLKPAYNFFGLSLAQKVLDAVTQYTQNRESASRLMQKYALTVLKTNLEMVLSGGFDEELKKRIQYFVQNRNNDGCATIDKENEDLVVQTTSLGGVTDVVRQSMEYVAAMFCEPVTKMWGLSPNGFSSGDVEVRNHYDNIKSQQEKMFGDPMRRVLRVIQQNMYEEIDDSIIFVFNPLSEDDERAIADTNKVQVDTDVALINAGIITADEARNRLIDDENSGYNTLDKDESNEMLLLGKIMEALELQIGGEFDKEVKKKAAEILLNRFGVQNVSAVLKDIEESSENADYSQEMGGGENPMAGVE